MRALGAEFKINEENENFNQDNLIHILDKELTKVKYEMLKELVKIYRTYAKRCDGEANVGESKLNPPKPKVVCSGKFLMEKFMELL